LQLQYERWQPRARYKVAADPTVEEVKKLCVSLRRSAKEERVLFHYNGHGVPRPTANGEVCCMELANKLNLEVDLGL
jgi:regulator-associated protein of mTOR